jgi:hypothetical protein
MSTASTPAGSQKTGGFRHFWRTLKQMFHEVVAGVFAVLALMWVNSAFRAWTRDTAPWLIGTALAVAAIFIFFAVTSFLRARRL